LTSCPPCNDMIEVVQRLYVGADAGVEEARKRGMTIVHAAKKPYHRRFVGYHTRRAPAGDKYLWAERENELALNLVDVAGYVLQELIEKALDLIDERLSTGQEVLVHCNRRESRGASIALLYLLRKGKLPARNSHEACALFRLKYPGFKSGPGMLEVLRRELPGWL